MTAGDAWVQAGQMLLDSSEVGEASARISELAMAIHGRFSGCRFGFGEGRTLVVQYDIYPDMTVGHVVDALGQLAQVGVRALSLFQECLEADHEITDERIDRAFGVMTDAN